MINLDGIYSLLSAWALQSEKYWFDIPGSPGLGYYGSGYIAWGVQTNQKYFPALAALAVRENQSGLVSADWAKERALSSLRFSLSSHCSGTGTCTDGSQWGHTWIPALGIERKASASAHSVPSDIPRIRMSSIIGADQKQYLLAANFSSDIQLVSLPPEAPSAVWMDLTTNFIASKIKLLPGQARLLCVSNIVTNL